MTPGVAAAESVELNSERAVARRLVHKHAVEEVFATGVAKTGEDAYVALTQLPRVHRLYNDTLHPYQDLLLVAEAARQGVMVVLHECLGVPAERRFVTASLDVSLADLDANRVSALPTEMAVDVAFPSRRTRRDGSLRGVEGAATCRIGRAHAATFAGAVLFVGDEAYAQLRDGAQPPRAAPLDRPALAEPRSAGRSDARNVLIAAVERDGDRWRTRVDADPADPVFFDHPQDHYPGMVMLEAARQAATACAVAATGALPERLLVRRIAASFRTFAELSAPLDCLAAVRDRSDEGLAADVELEQAGERVARFEIEVAVLGDGP